MPMNFVEDFVETHREKFFALADAVWQYAEVGYEEENSAKAHVDILKESGFSVTEGVAGIPTAFVAQAGSGGPIIGILGEFDALSGLSQQSEALVCRPSSEISTGNGHGCGHHLLGTSAHLAALAIKNFLAQHKMPGTVRFYGCPAEEGGFAKAYMARAGVFDDLDAALTWHPGVLNGIMNMEMIAAKQVYFRFKGVSAHAGVSPHLGRSALDAVELLNVGTNYLREHMLPDARIHYAITNSGGLAPNVVQARAEVLYMIRGPQNRDVAELYDRVCNVARGAALMTGCELEIALYSACSNVVLNTVLNELMHKNLSAFGAPAYDGKELEFAAKIHATANTDDIEMAGRTLQEAWKNPKPLFDGVDPLDSTRPVNFHGSTDVGDVSWIAPMAQCWTACFAFGTAVHSWQWVAQGKTSIAHKGMLLAAKTIAATALDLFKQPDVLTAAKEEKAKRLGGRSYECPLPADVEPPLPQHLRAASGQGS